MIKLPKILFTTLLTSGILIAPSRSPPAPAQDIIISINLGDLHKASKKKMLF